MPDVLEDLIYVSILAIYLTGMVGMIVYAVRHPQDKNGRPWADGPGHMLLLAVFIVAWPALWLAMTFGFTYGSKRK